MEARGHYYSKKPRAEPLLAILPLRRGADLRDAATLIPSIKMDGRVVYHVYISYTVLQTKVPTH